ERREDLDGPAAVHGDGPPREAGLAGGDAPGRVGVGGDEDLRPQEDLEEAVGVAAAGGLEQAALDVVLGFEAVRPALRGALVGPRGEAGELLREDGPAGG